MIPEKANPASAAARTGSEDIDCWAAIGTSDKPNAQNQAQNLVRRFGVRPPRLRLVPRPPPPRPRRLVEVRIAVSDGAPIGRSRLLRLRERDLAALIAEVERLEERA
jgi:hypothetical protein